MRQVQSQDRVPGLQYGCVGLHVGLRTSVRLHIGMLGAKQLLSARARQFFHDIGELASAVVALARVALGVFVGKNRTHGFKYGLANEVL